MNPIFDDETIDDEPDPIATWSLDELEHSADLGSVRSAWSDEAGCD